MGDFFKDAGKLGREVGSFGRSWGGAGRGLGSTARGIEKGLGDWSGLFGSQGGIPGGYDRGRGRMYRDSAYGDRAELRAMQGSDRLGGYRQHSRKYQRQLEREEEMMLREEMAQEEAIYGDRVAEGVNPRLARDAAENLREDPRIQAFLEENGRSANREGSWGERNLGMGTRGATDREVLLAFERLYEDDLREATGGKYSYVERSHFQVELKRIANGERPNFGTENSRYRTQEQSAAAAPVVTYAPQAAAAAPTAAAPSSWSNVTLPAGVTGGQTYNAPTAPAAATNTNHWQAFDKQARQDP